MESKIVGDFGVMALSMYIFREMLYLSPIRSGDRAEQTGRVYPTGGRLASLLSTAGAHVGYECLRESLHPSLTDIRSDPNPLGVSSVGGPMSLPQRMRPGARWAKRIQVDRDTDAAEAM